MTVKRNCRNTWIKTFGRVFLRLEANSNIALWSSLVSYTQLIQCSGKNFPLKHILVHWWYISFWIIETQQKSVGGLYHLCYSVTWKKNVWSAMDTNRNFWKPDINRALDLYQSWDWLVSSSFYREENRSRVLWSDFSEVPWTINGNSRHGCLISWPSVQTFYRPVQPLSFLGLKTDKHLTVMLTSFQRSSVIFICFFIEVDLLCFIECD